MPDTDTGGSAPDALHRRWRETHDPAALAALFDLVGGDLFRVAVSLCGDGAAAEDAVQETFLVAIREDGGFDASRRVMPWLLGILAHKAADVRRQARRVPDPLRLEPRLGPPDPATEAERREAVAQVRAALDRLPDTYRAVALLRWEYGLEPGDIARVLDQSPGTVRSLLFRARERLRRALRAVPLLMVVGSRMPRGLDSVRLILLREATAVATGTGAGAVSLLGGFLMANKALASAAAVLLLLGAGWFALRPGESPGTPQVVGDARGAPAGVTPATSSAPPASTPSPPAPDPATVPPDRCRLLLVVVDAAARPVAGARVEVRPLARPSAFGNSVLDRDDPSADPAATGATAGDGSATMPLLPGRWAVTVRADGFGVGGATSDLQVGAAEEPLRVVLYPAAPLEGRVLRSPGIPRPGVVVEAHPFGNEVLHMRVAAVSDAEGKYRLQGLPPGSLVISVRLPCGVLRAVGTVEVPGTSRFDILLPGGVTVRGRVIDDASGAPVEGAEVGVLLSEAATGLSGAGRTVSSRDGTFAFEDLPPGRIASLTVRKTAYLTWPDGGPGTDLVEGSLAVVQAPGSTLEKEVRLRRGAVVRGRVMLRDGTPVPGVAVSFAAHVLTTGMMQPRSSVAAVSGLDGVYVVSNAYPGRNVARVEADGLCAPGAKEATMMGTREDPRWTVEVPAAGEVEKDLVLVRGAVIEGIVVDGSGAAVAGARVGLQDSWQEEWSGPTVAAGADGTFRLAAAPPGDVRLLARGPGGLRGSSNRLTVQDEGVLGSVRISVGSGAILGGTVLGEDGGPVPGARISIHVGGVVYPGQPGDPGRAAWLRATGTIHPVGPDGRFRIEALGSGTWTLHAMAPGRSPVFRTVDGARAGSVVEDLRLVLPVGETLAGRVLGPEGGPVAGASVSVLPAWTGSGSYDWRAPSATAATDDAGRFRQDGLAAGDHLLRVVAPGFAAHASVVPAGNTNVDIRLGPPLAIAGRVLAEGGGPAAGVIVTAFAETRVPGVASTAETVTAGDGTFRIEGLTAGPHGLYVGGFAGDFVMRKVTGVAAGTLDVAVTLVRGLAIRGRLVDEHDLPVPGAQIRAEGEGDAGSGAGRNGMAQTSTDGSFALRGLLPGTYGVSAWILDQRWGAPPPVAGVPAGETDLLLKAKAVAPPPPDPPDGDLRIEGRVVLRGGGVPPSGTLVVALPEAAAPSGGTVLLVSARTDDRGAFLLEKLLEGRHRIVAAWRSSALAPGWSPAGTEAGASGLVIEVSPAARLAGRVLGAGAANVRWIRALPEGAPSAAFAWAEVGVDGTFDLGALPEGPVRLQGMSRAGGSVDLGMTNAPGDHVEVKVP